MPDPFTGAQLLSSASSSSSSASSSSSSVSSLPDQSSSHLSTISPDVQKMLDEIKVMLNDSSCTSAQAGQLSDQIDKLDSKIHEDSETISPEWLNFLSELVVLTVNAIGTKSYNEFILVELINELKANVNDADDINKILVPIISAAEETQDLEILEKIEGAAYISLLVARIKEMEAEITVLKTGNTKSSSQLLSESGTSPSQTYYSVFGATSSSADVQSCSSQKRPEREDEEDDTGIKSKVSRSLSS